MNTGGPAFPASEFFDTGDGTDQRLYGRHTGMTMRDYFAAKAMQTLVQNGYFDVTASKAYQMADAMLRAREAA